MILVSLAFKGGPAKSNELLLYLALADHADLEGKCFPGLERLAARCRQDQRNTRRVMHKLVRAEWVAIVKVGRRHEYILDVKKLCAGAVAASQCGEKLTSQETEFVARILGDKLSAIESVKSDPTPDKLSPVSANHPSSTPDNMSAIDLEKSDKLSSVEDTIADISAGQHRTFSTPTPDIQGRNSGHFRTLYREPSVTVIEPSGEPDDSPLGCAQKMFQELAIVATEKTLKLAAEAIRIQAEGMGLHLRVSMLRIRDQAKRAVSRGEVVSGFWFEDSKWKSQLPTAASTVGQYRGQDPPEPTEAEQPPAGVDLALGVQIWDGMRRPLSKSINPQSFDTWVKPIRAKGVLEGVLYLQIPSEEFAHVPDRYDFAQYLPEGMARIRVLNGSGAAA